MNHQSEPTRILGFDPGTATTGYGVIDYYGGERFSYITSGVICTTKLMPMPMRLKMIRDDVLSLLTEFQPDVVAIEQLFFFKNAKTVIPVAQARGVILEAIAHSQATAHEYTPMQVKLAVTGTGRADKRMVQDFVAKVLGHNQIIKPDDASDAVALAICHARSILAPALSIKAIS